MAGFGSTIKVQIWQTVHLRWKIRRGFRKWKGWGSEGTGRGGFKPGRRKMQTVEYIARCSGCYN